MPTATKLRRIRPAAFLLTTVLAAALLLLSPQDGSLRSVPVSAAGGGPEMALTITAGGFCSGADCYAEAGAEFKLGVDFVEAPANGYSGMETFIGYGDLVYLPAAGPADEVVWPDADLVVSSDSAWGPGYVEHGSLTAFIPPLPVSSFEGIGVELLMACGPSPADYPVSLLLDGPIAFNSGSKFIEVTPGLDPIAHAPKVNAITVHCVGPQAHPGDTDGDGCSDAREAGANPALGGDRDWLNPWDFYDVSGDRDRVVQLFADVLAVIGHVGTAPGPPYDVQYDRGPWSGVNSWNGTTGPDGVIDNSTDVDGVMAQVYHDCR